MECIKSLIIKHCMIMYTVYSFAFLTYHRLLGRWQGRKKNLERSSSSDSSFLGCLKCQPGRIYVLLADINVSVVFHEVNNEKVRPCPQNRRRERLQHLFRHRANSSPTSLTSNLPILHKKFCSL